MMRIMVIFLIITHAIASSVPNKIEFLICKYVDYTIEPICQRDHSCMNRLVHSGKTIAQQNVAYIEQKMERKTTTTTKTTTHTESEKAHRIKYKNKNTQIELTM